MQKNIVWNMIAQEITSIGKKTITSDQCLGKWKGLKAMYKKVLHNNFKTSRTRKEWEYFGAMRELLNMAHENDPLVWHSSDNKEDVKYSEEVQKMSVISPLKWSPADILCLINLYSKHLDKFESLPKTKAWDMIAQEIANIRRKQFTGEQCNGKWKGLKAMYKKVLDHNNQIGNKRKGWEYFDAMHEIFWIKSETDTLVSYATDTNMEAADEAFSDAEHFEWASVDINFFIGLYLKHKHKFENCRKTKIWDIISREMSNTYGKTFTSDQCVSKWKDLESIYRTILNHNNTGGNGKIEWGHFDAMHEVFSLKSETNPVITSSGFNIEILSSTEYGFYDENCEGGESTRSGSKRKIPDIDAKERRHREKMAKMDQFLDLFKSFVEHVTGKRS
ncbi:uncharacterized protein [Eurosta solidaginis]